MNDVSMTLEFNNNNVKAYESIMWLIERIYYIFLTINTNKYKFRIRFDSFLNLLQRNAFIQSKR